MSTGAIRQARWRLNHPELARERSNEAGRKLRAEKLAFLRGRKAAVGCSCGERDPIVLAFHHRDEEEKHPRLKNRLGHRGLTALGWDELRAEIEKCDVLCANCHLRLHHGGGPNNT